MIGHAKIKRPASCAFDRADMHKDILAAVLGLNEAIALLAIINPYRSR
jgi:hypothetical protein